MKKLFVFAAILLFAITCLSSCKSKSDDDEIVNFFTEGLTKYALEPFGANSIHSEIIQKDKQFADWKRTFESKDIMMISKKASFGEMSIQTMGNPYTTMIKKNVLLEYDSYLNSKEQIFDEVVNRASEKTGILFEQEGFNCYGSNDHISINIFLLVGDDICIALQVNNLTTNN